jgi:hypothetical protein
MPRRACQQRADECAENMIGNGPWPRPVGVQFLCRADGRLSLSFNCNDLIVAGRALRGYGAILTRPCQFETTVTSPDNMRHSAMPTTRDEPLRFFQLTR